MNGMKKTLLIVLCLIVAIGCKRGERFVISGKIEGLDSVQTIYLEQLTLPSPTTLDSCRVRKSGNVKFKSARPAYPELYQLRMGRQRLVFAVDSTETMTFRCHRDSLFSPREFTGSAKTLEICSLRASVRRLDSLSHAYGKGTASEAALRDSINAHKERVRNIIFSDPKSIVAYYALFQQVNGYYLFSPYDRGDRPMCAAVATAYHAFMPEYYRSKNLYNLVLEAIETHRQEESQTRLKEYIASTGAGFIDIALNDIHGTERRLSELKGKPILLDFVSFRAEGSSGYILDLRDVYETYHGKTGLEIYQVSVDASQLLWEHAVEQLPWISVRDADGYYSRLYNVSKLPTNFLIDASGNIIDRDLTAGRLKRKLDGMK